MKKLISLKLLAAVIILAVCPVQADAGPLCNFVRRVVSLRPGVVFPKGQFRYRSPSRGGYCPCGPSCPCR